MSCGVLDVLNVQILVSCVLISKHKKHTMSRTCPGRVLDMSWTVSFSIIFRRGRSGHVKLSPLVNWPQMHPKQGTKVLMSKRYFRIYVIGIHWHTKHITSMRWRMHIQILNMHLVQLLWKHTEEHPGRSLEGTQIHVPPSCLLAQSKQSQKYASFQLAVPLPFHQLKNTF